MDLVILVLGGQNRPRVENNPQDVQRMQCPVLSVSFEKNLHAVLVFNRAINRLVSPAVGRAWTLRADKPNRTTLDILKVHLRPAGKKFIVGVRVTTEDGSAVFLEEFLKSEPCGDYRIQVSCQSAATAAVKAKAGYVECLIKEDKHAGNWDAYDALRAVNAKQEQAMDGGERTIDEILEAVDDKDLKEALKALPDELSEKEKAYAQFAAVVLSNRSGKKCLKCPFVFFRSLEHRKLNCAGEGLDLQACN